MLPELITGASEIRMYQLRLEEELKKNGTRFEAHYKTRGLPGGIDHDAYYFPDFNIYWKTGDYSSENRYWNSFGVGKPRQLKDAFQISPPKVGIKRNIRGGFLKRGSEVFLLHRGPLGGGRKDGSHNICDIVPEQVQLFNDAGEEREGIVIQFLDVEGNFHSGFLPQMARVVKAVASKLGRE
ncbi:MAG: hypothetical protein WD851_22090 [Pirellulales bacterium]